MTVLIGFVGTHEQSVQWGAIQYLQRHGCGDSPGSLRLAQQVLLNSLTSCPERKREGSQKRCFSGWAKPVSLSPHARQFVALDLFSTENTFYRMCSL
jgi:hypothetical protein